MPIFAENQDRIYGDIIQELIQNTNLTRSSPGSKTRALIQAISRKMGRMWNQFDINMIQSYLNGAEGQFLDYLGNMMGLSRLGEATAFVGSADRNVKFYTDNGTFGDINDGNSILIPSGTICSTGTEGTGIQYRVAVSTIMLAGQSEAYVAVQSLRTGSNINIGAHQLIQHNFNNYVDSANGTLRVTNEASIVNGQDVETDTNYRFRIAHQVTAAEKGNATAIRLAALGVPGVADIVLVPFHRGIGSIDMLIKGTVPRISDNLISAVQSSVNQVVSQGIVYTARAPTEIGISMVGTLSLKNKLSTEEEAAIIEAATNNVTEYINTLDIGEEFVLQEIIERVLSASDEIRQMGTITAPFDRLYMYRPTSLGDNRIRSQLINNLIPDVDERVIVEDISAGTTPILFRIQ
jgi:uncharacterized phage protein gp47/JayE